MTRLSLVVGHGGVGKTTASIVLALRAAKAGERVLLLTVDPARRLADALGLPVGVSPTPLPVEGRLDASMLDRQAAWDHYVHHALPPDDAATLIAHPWFFPLVRTLNGGHTWIAIATLARLAKDGAYDRVVLDTPPSGHVLELLDAPNRLQRSLDPVRLGSILGGGGLTERAVGAVVRRIAGQDLLDDLRSLLQRIAILLDALREDAAFVARWLKGPETEAHIVLDARRRVDAASVAVWRDDLGAAGVRLGATILQRYPAEHPALEPPPPALEAYPGLTAWIEADAALREDARRDAEAAAASLGPAVLRIEDRPEGFSGLHDAARA